MKIGTLLLFSILYCFSVALKKSDFVPQVKYNQKDLRKTLTDKQFSVTQKFVDEYPNTGKYVEKWDKGSYSCVVCDENLFSSENKFQNNDGQVAFSEAGEKVAILENKTLLRTARELVCENCGSYLGELYKYPLDGDGQRFKVNSASLVFKAAVEVIG